MASDQSALFGSHSAGFRHIQVVKGTCSNFRIVWQKVKRSQYLGLIRYWSIWLPFNYRTINAMQHEKKRQYGGNAGLGQHVHLYNLIRAFVAH